MSTQMEAQIEMLEPRIKDTGKLPAAVVEQEVLRSLSGVYEARPEPQEGKSPHIERQETISDTEMLEKKEIDSINFKGSALNQERMDSFYMRQGVVLCIKDDTFIARLYDPSHLEPDEEAEFYIEDVSRDDLPLLEQGAIFNWNIGYHDRPSGRRRYSSIKFRRLPMWTKKDLVEIERKTNEVLELFADE